MKNLKSIVMIFAVIALISCGKDSKNEPSNNTPQSYTITLSETELLLKVGGTHQLQANVTPVSPNSIVWETSNADVAAIFYGKVTAMAEGEAEISATVEGVTAKCKVTVKNPHYKLVWEDNFDGNSLNASYWNVENGGGGGNGEKQYYTTSGNHGVANGVLTMTTRKEDVVSPVTSFTFNYTSARLTTKNKVRFTYGKIEARISLPSGRGTWPAFWLMPNDNTYGTWPASGEIDIMEHVGSDPRMVSNAYHNSVKNTSRGNNWGKRSYFDDIEGSFHTYGLEWTDDYNGKPALIFTFDGEITAASQKEDDWDWRYWPFDKDFYIILNIALGGSWGGTIDDNIFNNPVQMQVDWVRLYQLSYE